MYMRCLRHVVRRSAFAHFRPYSARFYSTAKTSKPLRILFCGSNSFSITSLRALHEEHKRDPQLIESIDVLCRPGKPVGRGRKDIREAPIKATAIELGLPVHERDTFTGWDLPQAKGGPINLLIAVSFGLFVPPRILNSVEYGGINLHPSLLPNLRGAAPLAHTIMQGLEYTGITLQTLDPERFDHGIILAQTPPRTLKIPDPDTCTTPMLLDLVTPIAADMLVQGIRDRLFVPPLQDVGVYELEEGQALVHAGKITSSHHQVEWAERSGEEVYRQYRALGRLWNFMYLGGERGGRIRVLYKEMSLVPTPAALATSIENQSAEEGVGVFWYVGERDNTKRRVFYMDEEGGGVVVGARGGEMSVRMGSITVQGKAEKPAAGVLRRFRETWEELELSGEGERALIGNVKRSAKDQKTQKP